VNNSEKLMAGCFAFQTAPFGVHPLDNARAKQYRAALVKEGKSWSEAEAQIRDYLKTARGNPPVVQKELERAKKFLKLAHNKARQ